MIPTPETADRIRHMFSEHPFILIGLVIVFALVVAILGALIMTEIEKQEQQKIQLYKDVKELMDDKKKGRDLNG